MAKKPKSEDDAKGHPSPWLAGVTGVKGVVPPGRRLANEKRPTKWSASGVKGVTPPGSQDPGDGPAADWAEKTKNDKAKSVKDNQRAFDAAKQKAAKHAVSIPADFDPMRPMEGFVPDIFASLGDPDDMKAFLKQISDFVGELKTSPESAEDFGSLIIQSRAPFEIIVSFTVLSALVGKSSALRRRYALSLERGAKVFFNLGGRLKQDLKPPRGLIPETVDALFYDLPGTAYEVPYAFATDAFIRMAPLLRDGSVEKDRSLATFMKDLYARYVGRRSFGDQALSGMFPLDLPSWTDVS